MLCRDATTPPGRAQGAARARPRGRVDRAQGESPSTGGGGQPQEEYEEGSRTLRRNFFTPYGRRIGDGAFADALPGTKSGFTGHEHDDDLGLINMRGRLYDPALRRFISPDPVEVIGDRYAYVDGRPTFLVDPTGYQAVSDEDRERGIIRDENGKIKEIARYIRAERAGDDTSTGEGAEPTKESSDERGGSPTDERDKDEGDKPEKPTEQSRSAGGATFVSELFSNTSQAQDVGAGGSASDASRGTYAEREAGARLAVLDVVTGGGFGNAGLVEDYASVQSPATYRRFKSARKTVNEMVMVAQLAVAFVGIAAAAGRSAAVAAEGAAARTTQSVAAAGEQGPP